jgi:hypothetical protein
MGRPLSFSLFHTHWVDDEEALPAAANTLKKHAVSALVREENGFLASHRAAVLMELAKTNAQKAVQEEKRKELEDELERRRESKRLEDQALARRRAEEEERRKHQVPPSLH